MVEGGCELGIVRRLLPGTRTCWGMLDNARLEPTCLSRLYSASLEMKPLC
jgi:hypothetical protein